MKRLLGLLVVGFVLSGIALGCGSGATVETPKSIVKENNEKPVPMK
jgi:hypothetical protein